VRVEDDRREDEGYARRAPVRGPGTKRSVVPGDVGGPTADGERNVPAEQVLVSAAGGAGGVGDFCDDQFYEGVREGAAGGDPVGGDAAAG